MEHDMKINSQRLLALAAWTYTLAYVFELYMRYS